MYSYVYGVHLLVWIINWKDFNVIWFWRILTRDWHSKKVRKPKRTFCIYSRQHWELQIDCNTFLTSFVRSHKSYLHFFLLRFKVSVLKHLKMISFWSKHVVFWRNNKLLCLTESMLFYITHKLPYDCCHLVCYELIDPTSNCSENFPIFSY